MNKRVYELLMCDDKKIPCMFFFKYCCVEAGQTIFVFMYNFCSFLYFVLLLISANCIASLCLILKKISDD